MNHRFSHRLPSQRGFARGFTLIELMVVLAIVAVISAITVGAFRSLSDTNQRTSCQANLTQVYQGLRLYMADSDGLPPLRSYDSAAKKFKNIGLWALWTFPADADPDKIAPVGEKPVATYLRSAKVFHCPADDDATRSELYDPAKPAKSEYNEAFLSYQNQATIKPETYTFDPAAAFDANEQTYWPVRAQDAAIKNQLLPTDTSGKYVPRPPGEKTVVTWCQFHRIVRDYDNVLFYDGSVQLLPRVQDNLDASCNPTGTLENWNRVPRRTDCGQ